jgi:hypothetical protein
MLFSSIHRLANLSFRTQANVTLPSLLAPPFAGFTESDNDGKPDIQQNIHKISSALNSGANLSAAQRQTLSRAAVIEDGALESPLLRAAPVRDYLGSVLGRPPEEVHISLQQQKLIGRDYTQHALHLFYLDEDNEKD